MSAQQLTDLNDLLKHGVNFAETFTASRGWIFGNHEDERILELIDVPNLEVLKHLRAKIILHFNAIPSNDIINKNKRRRLRTARSEICDDIIYLGRRSYCVKEHTAKVAIPGGTSSEDSAPDSHEDSALDSPLPSIPSSPSTSPVKVNPTPSPHRSSTPSPVEDNPTPPPSTPSPVEDIPTSPPSSPSMPTPLNPASHEDYTQSLKAIQEQLAALSVSHERLIISHNALFASHNALAVSHKELNETHNKLGKRNWEQEVKIMEQESRYEAQMKKLTTIYSWQSYRLIECEKQLGLRQLIHAPTAAPVGSITTEQRDETPVDAPLTDAVRAQSRAIEATPTSRADAENPNRAVTGAPASGVQSTQRARPATPPSTEKVHLYIANVSSTCDRDYIKSYINDRTSSNLTKSEVQQWSNNHKGKAYRVIVPADKAEVIQTIWAPDIIAEPWKTFRQQGPTAEPTDHSGPRPHTLRQPTDSQPSSRGGGPRPHRQNNERRGPTFRSPGRQQPQQRQRPHSSGGRQPPHTSGGRSSDNRRPHAAGGSQRNDGYNYRY